MKVIQIITIVYSLVVSCSLFAKVKVCYVGESRRFGPINEKSTNPRIAGFVLAKEMIKDFNLYIDFLFIDLGPEFSLIDKLEAGKKQGCIVYTGLITSDESLLAGPWLVKNNLFGISPTATAEKLQSFHTHFRTLMASSEIFAENIRSFIEKKSPQKIFIISFSDDPYSLNILGSYSHVFRKSPVTRYELNIPKGGTIDIKELKEITSAKRSAVLFTGYDYASLNVLEQLKKHSSSFNQNNDFIVGAPSWSFSDTLHASTKHINSFNEVYITYFPVPHKRSLLYQKYIERYGEKPREKIAFSYDSLDFIFGCSKKTGNNKEKLFECLRKNTMFEGQSGKITLITGKAHAKPTILIKKIKRQV